MSDLAPPFDYNDINGWITEVSPNTVHCKNTALFNYFYRLLELRAQSPFEWDMPEHWMIGKDFILYVLYRWGFFTVTELPQFGIVPTYCTLSGYGFYRQPTDVLISNPALPMSYKKHIGTECALVRLQPNYQGLFSIISHYAEKMALVSESLDINLLNTRLTYVFGAKNQNEANSFKGIMDEIAGGSPAVFYDKMLINEDGTPNWQLFEQNVGSNYLGTDLLTDYRSILEDFDDKIGIPNANIDKRERLNTQEVNANNQGTYALLDRMYDTIKIGVNQVKEIYGDIGFDVRYRYNKVTITGEEQGGENYES